MKTPIAFIYLKPRVRLVGLSRFRKSPVRVGFDNGIISLYEVPGKPGAVVPVLN